MTTSLAQAAAASPPSDSFSTPVASSKDGGRDALSPLPQMSSSLAKAAAAAIAKSGGSALAKKSSSPSGYKRKPKKATIKVVARIRPLSNDEMSKGCAESILSLDDAADAEHLSSSDKENSALPFGLSSTEVSSPAANQFKSPVSDDKKISKTVSLTAGTDPSKSKRFDYDAVLPSDASQKTVYDFTVGDAVKRNALKGINTTIIAYGQTNAGKTYTMNGPSSTEPEIIAEDEEMLSPSARPFVAPKHRGLSPKRASGKGGRGRTSGIPRRQASLNANATFLSEYDGIIPRAVHDLFSEVKKERQQAKIHLSYLEIYNDSIRDLLGSDDSSSENLFLRDDGNGVAVKNLTSLEVKTEIAAKTLMDTAAIRRTTGATGSNSRSSRSHAICVLTVSINHGKRKKTKAKLTLVDLAGSERLKETGAEGVTQQEGISINQDLFVLGKVVSALADKSKHIPYRDCKLTRILRDSLGGNCFTCFVACISPASVNLEESINTLRYAERAKAVTNAIKQNVVARSLSSTESLAMQRENTFLKSQISDLMTTLNELKASMTSKKDINEEDGDKNQGEGGLVNYPAGPVGENTNINTSIHSEIFLKTFSTPDGGDDDDELLSLDNADDSASFCGYSIASSITMLDDDSVADDSLDKDVAEKCELVNRLEEESSNLTSQINSLSEAVAATTLELEEVTNEQREVEASVKELVATKERLRYEIEAMKNQMKVLTTERKEILDEIEEVQELAAVITLLNEEQDARGRCEIEIGRLKEEAASSIAEGDKLRKQLTKIESEMDGLKKALEIMSKENEKLKKERTTPRIVEVPLSISNKVAGDKEKEQATIDAGEVDMTKAEHRAIRIHAAKMLWFAKKKVESKGDEDSMSALSSIASNDSTNYLNSANNSVASMESSNSKSSKKSLRKKLGLPKMSSKSKRKNKLPPTGRQTNIAPAQEANTKDTIDPFAPTFTTAIKEDEEEKAAELSIIDIEDCACNIFGENSKEMEFYLPRVTNSLCTCGKVSSEEAVVNDGDYFSLENILRPWQLEFLKSVGISTAKELVAITEDRKQSICKAMKRYRKVNHGDMPVTRQKCAIALHVWIKTCKTAMKNEIEATGPSMPNFLDISYCSRDDSISTMGAGSLASGVTIWSGARSINNE